MRAVGVVAGLVAALATPAAAQPAGAPTPGWRAAVRAALAFGHAEGKRLALQRYAIVAAPATKKDVDAALDKLDRLAQEARDAYAFVERYGSPFWSAAAERRIGDTIECQADKIVAMPPPPGMLPPAAAAAWRDLAEGLVKPLRDRAREHWERADAKATQSGVARHALGLLAGPSC